MDQAAKQLFFSTYLPVLIAIGGSFIIFLLKTNRDRFREVRIMGAREGAAEKGLELRITAAECSAFRNDCRSDILKEIGEIHRKINDLAQSSAHREGQFEEAIATLKEGVREIRLANNGGRRQ